MSVNVTQTLVSYVDSLYPIIYVHHFEPCIINESLSLISDNDTQIEVYDNALGRLNFKNRTPSATKVSLVQFLETARTDGFDNQLFLLLQDVHNELTDPKVIALLKRIADDTVNTEGYNATVFIVATRLVIPPELERYITVVDIPLPDAEEIESLITGFCATNEINIDADILGELAISLKGLDKFQIQQILNLAYNNGGTITLADKKLIQQGKKQIVKKLGMLEYIDTCDSVNDIGGLDYLKEYLHRKSVIFKDLDGATKFGIDVPKGILILGMPGCGKSLAAKATSALFDVPLVRLDVGRLLGKYVGESEENMARALKISEAISPCVLWIDEIEKAFAGVGESGGASDVTTRLFAQFLTWMQEKKNTVYIVATANCISKLPPEFLRKGRFDELFFVSMPDEDERRNILEIHLNKRRKLSLKISLSKIAKETNGYSGADLEAIVCESIEIAFSDGKREITTDDLLKAKLSIKSITEMMNPKLKEIDKQRKDMNFKSANDKVIKTDDSAILVDKTGQQTSHGKGLSTFVEDLNFNENFVEGRLAALGDLRSIFSF